MGLDLQYFKYELRNWWERIALRERINRNPKKVLGATVASVVLLLVIIIWLSLPEKVVPVEDFDKEWFYDLNTGKLFVERAGLIAPIETPSGPLADGSPAGVRAYVFSYGRDPNSAEQFIGFIEIADPNADPNNLGQMDLRVPGAEMWGKGRLIRRLEDEWWVPAGSPPGKAIIRGAYLPDETGRRPHYVTPR